MFVGGGYDAFDGDSGDEGGDWDAPAGEPGETDTDTLANAGAGGEDLLPVPAGAVQALGIAYAQVRTTLRVVSQRIPVTYIGLYSAQSGLMLRC